MPPVEAQQVPERVLVTGAQGFLGSRLVASYLANGAIVRGIVRTRDGAATTPGSLELVELDLLDLHANLDAFAGQDLVIHTAALMHARTPAERTLQERTNVDATDSVVAACRHGGVPRLVHISTTAAIGIPDGALAPADETFDFNLGHFDLAYNETKRRAEQLVLAADQPGLQTVVASPGFTFGRHRNGYRGGEVVERVLRRRVVPCTHGGLSVVHVDDVVDRIRSAAAVGRSGERYILSGPNVSFHEIAESVARVTGERKLVLTVPDPVRDLVGALRNSDLARRRGRSPLLFLDGRYAYQYYSSEKARRELGYEHRSLDAIVQDALSHLRGRDEASDR